MNKRFSFLPLFIIVSLCLTASMGWSQTRRVKFVVKDTGGKPVEGVAISMSSDVNAEFQKVLKTDNKGQCKFLIPMEIATMKVVLEKEGYQKLDQSLTLKNLRSAQDSFSYDHSFMIYRSDEKTPEQKYKEYQDSKETREQFEKGTQLFQAEDFKGAIEAFSKAVEINNKFFEAYQNLAAAYFRADMLTEAIDAAKKALDLNPESAATLKLLSVAYSTIGDEKTALEYQDKLKLLPDAVFSPEEYYNMAVVEANEGRDAEAVTYFKKAIEGKTDFAAAYYQLGLALFRLKNTEESKAALEKYLELDPKGEDADTAKKLLEFIKKQS
jgi:tetratricopeptide (TPR) repeat protein